MPLIECKLRRDKPIDVSMGSETYRFRPDSAGRVVAEVHVKEHVECFLSVPYMYQEVAPAKPLVAPPPKDMPPPPPKINGADDSGKDAPKSPTLADVRGISEKLVERLGELDIVAVRQVAEWTEKDVERIEASLGWAKPPTKGRIARENWVGQAQTLLGGAVSAAA